MRKPVLKSSLLDPRSIRQALASLLLVVFPFEQALQAAGPTLPSGGTFVAGSGTIAGSAGAVIIHQASTRGIIDWRNFSIGNGRQVLFFNGSGATLNRVTGNQMSVILGSLTSTGTVYLINPQGVLIGPHGRIKTGGDFVASTLNLPNNSFLSGGALLFDGNSKAFVKNLGTVSSTGGSIFLIADRVSNSGSLSAPNGSVGMGAGEQLLLKDSNSDQRIFVNVAGGDATNSGTIAAAQIELKANGGNVFALAGNNGGQIRATGIGARDGHVWLISDGGTTKVTGSVSAQNASGSGGFIETSGHTVDIGQTSIRTGAGGSWLVDPVDLTIDASAASTIQTALNGGTNVTESTSSSGSSGYGTTAAGNGDINVSSGISWTSSAALTLSAYRNLNIQNGVTIASSGSGSLTLQSDNAATGTGTVIFNGTGNVHFTGSGNVDLFYHPSGYPTATNYSGNVTMGSGVFTPYMTVDTATDLQNINSNLSGKYALNTNIDASSIANFIPIAHGSNYTDSSQGFSGIFDGRSHTINHLTINDSTDTAVGLFAQTSSSGVIRNVGLLNASVHNSVDNSSLGALVGENFGTVTSSYAAGSVSTTGNGNTFVGGLVGENDGVISNSYSSASVSALTYSGCDGCIFIGGLAGDNGFTNPSASITSSLATGPVSTTGPATATIGGFAGENDANISSSYFDSQSTGQSGGSGFYDGTTNSVTGQTTAQLKSGSLPSGFSSTFWIASAGSYPKLSWEIPPGILVTGTVYNGITPLGSVTVVGLANGTSFGSTTTNGSGNYTLTAPAGTTGVLAYLTGGFTGNTFSNTLGSSFPGVDIYTNSLRLINVTNNNYTSILTALASALGSNSGSNFLFSISGGNLTLNSGANFGLISSVATTIDQSIAGTGTVLLQSSNNLTIGSSVAVSANGTGTPLTLISGGAFTNNAGASALSVSGGGRWLVYSQNPANDTLGSLSYGFKQYNATYGSTTVGQSTGNGLLYTLAPTVATSLTGTTSKTYDGSTTATITGANLTSTGALSGDTATLSSTGATYADKNAGSGKSVTATGVSAAVTDSTGATVYGYQVSSSASGNIGTINAAQLTYTANSASRTYGGANPAFSGNVTGFVGADTLASATTGTLSFTSPATTVSNTGSYAIDGSGLTANNGNYTFQQAAANATALTINPAALTYTANSASRTYGSSNPAFSGTVTGFVNSDTQASATAGALSFSSSATTASNTGSYAINGSGLTANNSNYTFQQAAANTTALTINPAALTYTANSASRTYGSSNPAFSGTVTGFVNSDTQASVTTGALSFSSSATTASNTGAYAINGSGLTANNGNYTLQQAAGNATALTINPAELTYTANSASRTYGSANPIFSGSVTGFVGADTQATATTGALSFASPATTASNTGYYAINGSGLTANNGNYTFQQTAGNTTALTINPAALTYAADTATRAYGSANPTFSGTVTGFVNSDTLASTTIGALLFTSPATTASNTGSYAINGSGLTANNGNYTLQQAASNATALTINPAALSYTANPVSRTYGSSNPTLTGMVTGLANGDSLSSVTSGSATFATGATSASHVGAYAINGSGLAVTGGNYILQQAPVNASALTITPAQLTASILANNKVYDATTNATGQIGALSGILSSDSVSVNAANATYAFGDKNIGTGKAVTETGATLAGASASDYVLSVNAGSANITPASLSATLSANNKVYDSTTSATGQIGALSGVLGSDAIALNTSAVVYNFADKNVGTGKTVSETGAVLAGADAANYQLTIRNGIANINPAPVTVSILPATRPAGTPNPAFLATYSGQPPAGVDISALLSSISFQTNATSASAAGTYQVTGMSNYPNVDLTILPGTLTILPGTEMPAFVDTPRVNPALVTAKIAAPPLPMSAISPVLSSNSLGIFQINYSTDWSAFNGSGIGRSTPLAVSSFLPETSSGKTYQGGIRPW